MGAFFLYNNTQDTDLCLDDARNVFARKGFSDPRIFSLGELELWLYQKQLVNTPNFVEHESGAKLFAVGTVVYRGLGYHDSLRRLLGDLRTNRLDWEELIGSFCLLYWDATRLNLIRDRSNSYQVFANQDGACFSSAFLAMVAAAPCPFSLNFQALMEKLATGFIMAPDTAVEGIVKLDSRLPPPFLNHQNALNIVTPPPVEPQEDHTGTLRESLQRQVDVLQHHFVSLDTLYQECDGDLGMSSGYDSRLVLACTDFLSAPIALHTHATEAVHEPEARIVERIAGDLNLPLTRIPTQSIETMDAAEAEHIMLGCLYHFDGRSSRQRGAFHPTYTAEYRKKVLGNAPKLGLNGVGGELYRNDTCTQQRGISLRGWFDLHVYFHLISETLSEREEFEGWHEHVLHKAGALLGDTPVKTTSFRWLRRYYSEVRGPNSDANIVHAQNQISFFHAPFLDVRLIAEGIAATHYMRPGPSYETNLISTIDPALASYPSTYGYPFDNIPFRQSAKDWVKSQIPEHILLHRIQSAKKRAMKQQAAKFTAYASKAPFMLEIRDILRDSGVLANFTSAVSSDEEQRRTTLFFGAFLREFQDKLKF